MKALLVSLLLLFASLTSADDVVKKLYKTVLPGVVEIYVGGRDIGTAFVISSNDKETVLVTAKHVVDDEESYMVVQSDGNAYKVKSVKMSSKYDVARLVAEPFRKTHVFKFNTDKIDVGEDLYTIGNPGREDYVISAGFKNREDKLFEPKLTISAFTWYGNSGGPILDSLGQVVGVLVGGPPQQGNISTCVTAATIIEELANMESKK